MLDAAWLSYVAADGCPSRETFIEWVERRGGDPTARGSAAGRAFEVEIRRRGERYVGTLTARAAEDETADARSLEGQTCEEVAEALSITLALQLERSAASPPSSVASVDPPGEPSTPPPAPAAQLRGRSRWGSAIEPVPGGSLRFEPRFSITLSMGASLGLVPITSTRYDAVFRMASFVTLPNGAQRIVGPILRARLGFTGSPQAEYRTAGASAAISGQSLGLGLCWSPHYDTAGLVLLGCGELGLAGYSIRVEESSGAERDSSVQLLGTAGPVISAEYSLGPLHVGATLGGNLVFGRLEGRTADGARLFQSKRWETYGTVGIGGHW